MGFVINYIFLIEPFFLHDQTSWQKLKHLEDEMSFWGEIKHFSSFLKSFQLSKIVSDLRVHLKDFHLWDSSNPSEKHLQ